MCKSFVHLPLICAWSMWNATTFPTNESNWSRKVSKVRKDLVKPGGLPQYISNFLYFLYFSAVAVKELRRFLPPGFTKIFRTVFTFVDQSDSFVGKVVASRIDREKFTANEQNFCNKCCKTIFSTG